MLFPYTALNEDELSLQEGQIITIVSKDIEDKGWWRGEIDGKVGVFPDNFVKMLPATNATTSTNATPTKNAVEEKPQKKPIRPPNSPALKKPTVGATSTSSSGASSATTSASSVGRKSSFNRTTNENNKRSSFGKSTPPPKPKPSSASSSSKAAPPPQQPKPTSVFGKLAKFGGGKAGLHNGKSEKPESKAANQKAPPPSAPVAAPTVAITRASVVSNNELDLDVVELSSAKLAHPTAGRVKAPKRRPPSSSLVKDSSSSSLVSFCLLFRLLFVHRFVISFCTFFSFVSSL